MRNALLFLTLVVLLSAFAPTVLAEPPEPPIIPPGLAENQPPDLQVPNVGKSVNQADLDNAALETKKFKDQFQWSLQIGINVDGVKKTKSTILTSTPSEPYSWLTAYPRYNWYYWGTLSGNQVWWFVADPHNNMVSNQWGIFRYTLNPRPYINVGWYEWGPTFNVNYTIDKKGRETLVIKNTSTVIYNVWLNGQSSQLKPGKEAKVDATGNIGISIMSADNRNTVGWWNKYYY